MGKSLALDKYSCIEAALKEDLQKLGEFTSGWIWVIRFGPKIGQIGPKWDKSGTFTDQISVHFGAAPKYTEI